MGQPKHDEIEIKTADITTMSNYGPAHHTYNAIYFTLTGLHALHVIGGAIVIFYLWGLRRKDVEDRPGAFHQSRRNFRLVLALRRPGLDFPVPCPLLTVIYERPNAYC